MKIFNFFAHVFAIFAFLTLGSLLVIFGIHLLDLADILLKIREIYVSPWKSLQTIMIGFLFITIGLAFTKALIKKGKVDAIIFNSEIGPIVISLSAIEDVTRKVLKRFHLVKDFKLQTRLNQRDAQLTIKLVLWSGGKVQELIAEIQEEIRIRLRKLLGPISKIEIACDVIRIEDHEASLPVRADAEEAAV